MMDIQSKIQIAVFQADTKQVEELLSKQAPEWYTVTFTVQRTRKYSNVESRKILKMVLNAVTLSECQRSYIKDVMLWDMGSQVNSILKSYV